MPSLTSNISIIFTILAGGRGKSAFSSPRTSPESASMQMVLHSGRGGSGFEGAGLATGFAGTRFRKLVFSGTAVDFDIEAYVKAAGGKLSTHREYLGSTGWTTGSEAIKRLAYENSINPRLLLALLEYESRWVRGESVDAVHGDYPMGYINLYYKGLFGQLLWAVNQLSTGYYGWRTGTLTEVQFPDGW